MAAGVYGRLVRSGAEAAELLFARRDAAFDGLAHRGMFFATLAGWQMDRAAPGVFYRASHRSGRRNFSLERRDLERAQYQLSRGPGAVRLSGRAALSGAVPRCRDALYRRGQQRDFRRGPRMAGADRSEEHTSELPS